MDFKQELSNLDRTLQEQGVSKQEISKINSQLEEGRMNASSGNQEVLVNPGNIFSKSDLKAIQEGMPPMDYKHMLSVLDKNMEKQGFSPQEIKNTNYMIENGVGGVTKKMGMDKYDVEAEMTAAAQTINFLVTHNKDFVNIAEQDKGNPNKLCKDFYNLIEQDKGMMENRLIRPNQYATQSCQELVKNYLPKMEQSLKPLLKTFKDENDPKKVWNDTVKLAGKVANIDPSDLSR